MVTFDLNGIKDVEHLDGEEREYSSITHVTNKIERNQ